MKRTLTTTEALERRVLTAREAEETLGIPAGTTRGWASRELLYAVADENGEKWYKLRDLIELLHTTKRRARHVRPTRRAATAA